MIWVYGWFVGTLVMAALVLAASVHLFRVYHTWPTILLVLGSALALIVGVVGYAQLLFQFPYLDTAARFTFTWIVNIVGGSGGLLFVIGFISYAFKQKSG